MFAPLKRTGFKKHENCGGFSLLEILVGTVLGLLLLEVVFQNYLSAKNVYRAQNDLAVLGDNIRFADFVLWQNIVQAGFAGCRKISEYDLSNPLGKYFGVYGYDSAHVPDYLKGKVMVGTDVIVVTRASADVAEIADDIVVGGTAFQVLETLGTVKNHFLLISDCKNADLIEIDGRRGNTLYSKTEFKHAYNKEFARVRSFEEVAYFISDTGRLNEKQQPIYALYSSANHGKKQELVSGIGNMQIFYGIDTVGSHKVDKYLKASDIDDPAFWGRVLVVVISLTMQSSELLKQKNLYIRLRARD